MRLVKINGSLTLRSLLKRDHSECVDNELT